MLPSLFLLQVATGLFGLQGAPQTSVAQRPGQAVGTNAVVILLDDVGLDQVGAYAASYPDLVFDPCTPNIDALAASGMRFTNAWGSAVCSPSRAQLLTGRLARTIGVGTVTEPDVFMPYNIGLQVDQPTFGDALPGYSSAAVGKWHISDPFQDGGGAQHPVDLGFGDFRGSLYNLESDYDHWKKTSFPSGNVIPGYPVYATADTTSEALSLVATLPEPWVIYVAYNAAHTPLHCPVDMGISLPPDNAANCTTDWCASCVTNSTDVACAAYGLEACQSRAMVQVLDHEIGRLLNGLDQLDTAVVLASDNGTARRPTVPPFNKDHGKGTVYQGGLNVPLIVRVPGGLVGVNHDLVALTDVYATLADLAGVVLAPDPLRDSVSLAQYVHPASNLSAAIPRTHVYSEFFGPNYVPTPAGKPPIGYDASFDLRTMRNSTHKLMERRSWSDATQECMIDVEFYRINDGPGQDPADGPDPFEANDLMLSPTTWTHADMDAFIELDTLLRTQYPALRTGNCP